MPILILIEVQYLQNVVFSFEKHLNGQNLLLIRFLPPDKKISQQNFPVPPTGGGKISPQPLNAIWKTLHTGKVHSANNTTQELKVVLLISTVPLLQVKYQETMAMGMPVNNVFQ